MLKTLPANMETAIALAELPLSIRGFGPVKLKAMQDAAERRKTLKSELQKEPVPSAA